MGDRGGSKEMVEEATIAPRVGYAIIHIGRKLHEVLPVTAGERPCPCTRQRSDFIFLFFFMFCMYLFIIVPNLESN